MKNKKNLAIIFFSDEEKYNWSIIDEKADYFVAQLKKELTKNHLLFDKNLTALAKDNASDDVLFADENKYYIVHLTYTTTHQDNFPKYESFENIQEVEEYFSKNYT